MNTLGVEIHTYWSGIHYPRGAWAYFIITIYHARKQPGKNKVCSKPCLYKGGRFSDIHMWGGGRGLFGYTQINNTSNANNEADVVHTEYNNIIIHGLEWLRSISGSFGDAEFKICTWYFLGYISQFYGQNSCFSNSMTSATHIKAYQPSDSSNNVMFIKTCAARLVDAALMLLHAR